MWQNVNKVGIHCIFFFFDFSTNLKYFKIKSYGENVMVEFTKKSPSPHLGKQR